MFHIISIVLLASFIPYTSTKYITLEVLEVPSFEFSTDRSSTKSNQSANITELELDYKFRSASFITISCKSDFPIRMIYDYELQGLSKTYFPQVDQYVHRTFHDFWNTSAYSFRAHMKMKKKAFVELGNISCENFDSSGSNRDKINFYFDKINDTLTILKVWVSTTQVVENVQNCETRITVKDTENGGEWSCRSELMPKDKSLPIKFAYCYSSVDCANILRKVQQENKSCITRLSSQETCQDCKESHLEVGKLKQFHSQLVICMGGQSKAVAAQVFFYGFGPNGTQENHKLHLSLSEVAHPEEEMLFIYPPKRKDFLINETIEFECHGIQHIFSLGHVFGVQVDNGSLTILPAGGPYKREEITNARIVKEKITFTQSGKTRIYCFAPLFHSLAWINKSITVNVLTSDDYYYYYYDYETAYRRNLSKLELEKRRLRSLNRGGGNDGGIGWITIAGIVGGMSTLLIVIGVVAYVRIEKLKRVLVQLTEAEIREFLEGAVVTLSPAVTGGISALDEAEKRTWESLPYNDKYEVAKSRIHFEEHDLLGAGAYGRVFKGVLYSTQHSKPGVVCAVKTIKPGVDVMYFKALLSELKVMAYLGNGHENIVQLMGASTEGIKNGEIYIAVELCGSNLLQVVRKMKADNLLDAPSVTCGSQQDEGYANVQSPNHESKQDEYVYENVFENGQFSFRDLLAWSYQIADGMVYIAEKRVVHGDLSLRNVLLSTSGKQAKICDFGLARQLVDYNYLKTEQCPLPWKYLSIESLTEMKFSTFSDVWSYGITLWELYSLGEVPYPGLAWTPDFPKQLKDGLRLSKPDLASDDLYQTMLKCWATDPRCRCTFPEIKLFFKSKCDQ